MFLATSDESLKNIHGKLMERLGGRKGLFGAMQGILRARGVRVEVRGRQANSTRLLGAGAPHYFKLHDTHTHMHFAHS